MTKQIKNICSIVLIFSILLIIPYDIVFAVGQNLMVTVDNGSIVVPDAPIITQVDDTTTNSVNLNVKVGDSYAEDMLSFVVTVTNLFTNTVTTENFIQTTDTNSETILIVTDLDPGTEYKFEVRYKYNGNPYSADSASKSAITNIDAPALNSIESITENSVKLNVDVDPAFIGSSMDFVIEVNNGNNIYTIHITQNITNTHIILPIDDLETDTNYIFKVKYAREDTLNFSTYSNEKSIITKKDVDLSKPTIININNVTTNSMELVVDTGDNDNKDLELVVRVTNEKTGAIFKVDFTKKTNSNGIVTLGIIGLNPDTQYTFEVKFSIKGDSEESSYSNPKSQLTNPDGKTQESIIEICNAGSTITILQSELQIYLNQGAVIGKCQITNGVKVLMCNEGSTISVLQNKVQQYLDAGAQIGECVIGSGVHKKNKEIEKEESRNYLINNIKKRIIPTKETKKAYQTTMMAGLGAGILLSLAAGSIPLFTTMPGMFGNTIFLHFLELFGVIGRRKKERNWGIVFDDQTHMPIPAAKITLLDKSGKEMLTTYSDKDGRFGFLAQPGMYVMNVFKKNYTLITEMGHDDVYGNLYDGKEIIIKEDQVVLSNIAMKNNAINWQEYADKKSKQYMSKWSIIKKYVFASVYLIGFIVTMVVTLFYPSIFNFIMLGVYIVLFIYQKFFSNKKYGVVETNTGKPIPFALVSLHNKDTNEKKNFTVTDSIGRYYLLSDNGKYQMKVKGQPVSGNFFEKVSNVHITDGIVREDIIV